MSGQAVQHARQGILLDIQAGGQLGGGQGALLLQHVCHPQAGRCVERCAQAIWSCRLWVRQVVDSSAAAPHSGLVYQK